MRILIVHDMLGGSGGAEKYIRETSLALVLRGHDVAFLTTAGQSAPWVQEPLYTLKPALGWRSGWRAYGKLRTILRKVNPELIYLHNLKQFGDAWTAPGLIKLLVQSAPSAWFVHDIRLLCPNETKMHRSDRRPCTKPVGTACLRGACCALPGETHVRAWRRSTILRRMVALLREVDRVIAPSGYIAEELIRNGLSRERVVVVPHFTEHRASGHHPCAEPTLLWVGRFAQDDTKGFRLLTDILGRVADLPWQALLVGGGDMRTEAEKLVARLGLSPRVSFVGPLGETQLAVLYERARAVLITSRVPESFCIVGIEAMAHARPVVAFALGGVSEWLVDGSTGFLVPQADCARAAEAVRRLLNDPGLAERLGEAGRKVATQRFRRSAHMGTLVATLEAASLQRAGGRHAGAPHPFTRPMGVG